VTPFNTEPASEKRRLNRGKKRLKRLGEAERDAGSKPCRSPREKSKKTSLLTNGKKES